MKVEAFKCPHCERVYLEEEKQRKCELRCARDIKETAKEEKRNEELSALRDYVRLNAESVDDIPQLVNEVINKIDPRIGNVTMKLDIRHYRDVSNSHCAPVGKKTNWCGQNKNEPSSYPGYCGNISWSAEFKKKLDTPFYSIFDKYTGIRGICTGGGNGSGDDRTTRGFSGGVSLFLMDFPKIQEKFELFGQLRGQYQTVYDESHVELYNQVANDDLAQQSIKFIDGFDAEIEAIRKEAQNKINELKKTRNDVLDKLNAHIEEKYRQTKMAKLDTRYSVLETLSFDIKIDNGYKMNLSYGHGIVKA